MRRWLQITTIVVIWVIVLPHWAECIVSTPRLIIHVLEASLDRIVVLEPRSVDLGHRVSQFTRTISHITSLVKQKKHTTRRHLLWDVACSISDSTCTVITAIGVLWAEQRGHNCRSPRIALVIIGLFYGHMRSVHVLIPTVRCGVLWTFQEGAFMSYVLRIPWVRLILVSCAWL